MRDILIINTGGTFNKQYDPIKGELDVDQEGKALEEIASKWLCEIVKLNIIGKDSLDMTGADRLQLLALISGSDYSEIIVVHGTDTMDITAEYLADAELDKRIVLTGAMVPFSIDPVEATANLALAYGYLQAESDHGVYIAMHGVVGSFEKMKKDRAQGKFIYTR